MNTICLDTGRTWLVAKTGNNGNSGHPSSYPINLASDAKLTIDAAVTAASSGDTIIIWPGDYAENVNAGSKALRFMGFSRTKSKIVPSSGAALTLTDGCAAMNLAVESLTVAISSTGIYSSGKKNIRIEDCDIYAAADGLYISNSEDVLIRNCRIRGKYDGANFGGTSALIVENCVFRADGTYGTTSHSRASLTAASGIFRNCHFIVSRSDNSSQMAAAFYAGGVGRIKFENCMFQAITQSPFNGSVYGFYTDSGDIRADLKGCIFYTLATGTP
jgi:parallel beta-helix repeat protein